MSKIVETWKIIETQYNNGTFPADQLDKIDIRVHSHDIENIRNGLTLMTTLAPENLCRYLRLDGESVVLRDVGKFVWPSFAERVLVATVKSESMWQALYESGAFKSMALRGFDDAIENLSESEKDFCVRMTKEMVRVSAGEFMMGALEHDEDAWDAEKPRHKVTLTRDFLIGKYAVTQALWESVMGSNLSHFKSASRPVECVSWFDCVLFCNKLSKREGLKPVYTINGENVTCNWNAQGYRLPTEAEWEYSARSGQRFKYAGSNNVDEVAWYDDNSDYETHPVGLKQPNGFGLYDMSGNVEEWCWDRFGAYSSVGQTDPMGPDSGSRRVNRGGSLDARARGASVSARGSVAPTHRSDYLGFRLSRSVQ